MKNLIWDLDGTLIDSYGVFMKALEKTYSSFSLDFNADEVYPFIKRYSVNALFEQEKEDFGALKSEFTKQSILLNDEIELMDGAKEVLDWTRSKGFANFIYTHKGNNAYDLLNQLGISDYFVEVITSDNGFPRKPDPEAINYLLNKYKLDQTSTYYIGDRLLDVQVAVNSGIQSINFLRAEQSIKMEELNDLIKILE